MLPSISFALPARRIIFSAVILTCVLTVSAKTVLSDRDIANLSPGEIEENIQKCAFAKSLAAHKVATTPDNASMTKTLFTYLFPSSSPAINALLATAYISGPPNFLLALCPPNIDPSSLSIMVAFAVGGLLGDTLFHLLPEIFLGEDEPDHVRLVVLEPNRNLLLGLGILVGLVTFMAMDKALRIATGGEGHSHDHHAGGSDVKRIEIETHQANGHATGVDNSVSATGTPTSKSAARNRKNKTKTTKSSSSSPSDNNVNPTDDLNPSVKLAGLLNLIADFTHNITDGLALSTSFYSSPVLGATTTMAVFFHEIPHEVGDFALLIQSGFSKRKAMAAQFVTAIGAFLGTFIGIFVQEFGGSKPGSGSDSGSHSAGIWGTSLTWGDMLLPFTAGTFLYVGTVAVIPELLENGKGLSKGQEVVKTLKQFGAMAVGAAIMIAISWS